MRPSLRIRPTLHFPQHTPHKHILALHFNYCTYSTHFAPCLLLSALDCPLSPVHLHRGKQSDAGTLVLGLYSVFECVRKQFVLPLHLFSRSSLPRKNKASLSFPPMTSLYPPPAAAGNKPLHQPQAALTVLSLTDLALQKRVDYPSATNSCGYETPTQEICTIAALNVFRGMKIFISRKTFILVFLTHVSCLKNIHVPLQDRFYAHMNIILQKKK